MVLNAEAKITGDKNGRRLRINIPSSLALDSAFPFKKGDKVIIRIDTKNKKLIIEKG